MQDVTPKRQYIYRITQRHIPEDNLFHVWRKHRTVDGPLPTQANINRESSADIHADTESESLRPHTYIVYPSRHHSHKDFPDNVDAYSNLVPVTYRLQETHDHIVTDKIMQLRSKNLTNTMK